MRVILATLKGYNPDTATEETLYFSDKATFPVNVYGTPIFFEPRISSITGVSRRIFSRGTISGRSSISGGEITVINDDGVYDDLNNWGFDERSIEVRYGDLEADGSFTEVNSFKGVLEQPDIELNSKESMITFRMKDKFAILNKRIQEELFIGNNVGYIGVEGTIELKGLPKPLCFGECYNITPTLVNSVLLKYMVHNGPIQEVLNVYDKGAALAYTSGTPTGGQWTVDLSTGIITLGAKPEGSITCDVKGAKFSSVYVDNVHTIVKQILLNYTDLTIEDISSDFDTFVSDATVGIYLNMESLVIDVIDKLCNSIGAYCLFDSQGLVRIGYIKSVRSDIFSIINDESSIVLVDESGSILVDTDTLNYNDTAPIITIEPYEVLEVNKYSGNDTSVPSYRLELSYKKNYTIQYPADLAGVVLDDLSRPDWLSREYSKVIIESPNIKIIYKSSETFVYDTLLVDSVVAEDTADRLSRLYNVKRDFYSVVLPLELANAIDLNDVVVLKLDRFGMSSGLRFLVVGRLDFTPKVNQITLELWG